MVTTTLCRVYDLDSSSHCPHSKFSIYIYIHTNKRKHCFGVVQGFITVEGNGKGNDS